MELSLMFHNLTTEGALVSVGRKVHYVSLPTATRHTITAK
jgi:hypothetical protein